MCDRHAVTFVAARGLQAKLRDVLLLVQLGVVAVVVMDALRYLALVRERKTFCTSTCIHT